MLDNHDSSSSNLSPRWLDASKTPQLPKLILYFSFALALLSAVNVALLPTTLSRYHSRPLSDSELEALPYGDARLGLDRAAKMMPPPEDYHYSWPDKIARVSRKLKRAVWGDGVQVYITVEVCIAYFLHFHFPRKAHGSVPYDLQLYVQLLM